MGVQSQSEQTLAFHTNRGAWAAMVCNRQWMVNPAALHPFPLPILCLFSDTATEEARACRSFSGLEGIASSGLHKHTQPCRPDAPAGFVGLFRQLEHAGTPFSEQRKLLARFKLGSANFYRPC